MIYNKQPTGPFIHISTVEREKYEITQKHELFLKEVHEKWVNKISNWIDNKTEYPSANDYLASYQNIIHIADESDRGVEFVFDD